MFFFLSPAKSESADFSSPDLPPQKDLNWSEAVCQESAIAERSLALDKAKPNGDILFFVGKVK